MPVSTALLIIALFWTSYRLGVVENERYALSTNLCPDRPGSSVPDLGCVRTVQTRSPWFWNVYYGLVGT